MNYQLQCKCLRKERGIMNLPKIFDEVSGPVGQFFRGCTKKARISRHVTAEMNLVVEQVAKKKDFLPDILELSGRGMKVQDIAELLGLSKSYVYKLLKA